MKKLSLLIAVVFFAGRLYAGGFQLNEHGARAMAMAGAFTGLANDPSALYFNPAGITQLTGTHFMAGVTLIAPTTSFTGPLAPLSPTLGPNQKWEMDSQVFTPINIYATQQLTDDLFLGLGVNNQYGLGTKWDPAWAGRYLAGETEIKSFFFTAAAAYKFSDQFSLSLGAVFATANVLISREIPYPITGAGADVNVRMEGDANTFGFSAGLLYKPTKELSLGLSYRSEMEFDFEGTATSTPATFYHPLLKVNLPFPNGNITAPLTTPQNITFGIGYMPSPELTLTADFQYVGWSSYDKLTVTFTQYDADFNPANGTTTVQSADRNYQNTFIVRAGAEYLMSDCFALRGGLLFDKSPAEAEYVDPTLPDANRVGLNIGFGYKFTNNLSVDFAYMLLIFAERDITTSHTTINNVPFLGKYSNVAHLFGVNFSYNM